MNLQSNKEYNLELINGYLDVFSQINTWSNHSCNFELNCVQKKSQSFSDVLNNMFSNFNDVQLEISQIDDIKYFLTKQKVIFFSDKKFITQSWFYSSKYFYINIFRYFSKF